jgi:hypothetical protein
MSEKTLTMEEREILVTSLKKHHPDLVSKVDQMDSGMLDFDTINNMREAVGDELVSEGIDQNSQISAYGFKLENLIDRLATIYLWPIEKEKLK